MSRAAWVVVAASGVICGAIALSPGPVANAEGEDDWFSPATSTSITAPPSTTTSTTVASTTTTEDEWLPPASVTSTTQATTGSASTTSTTRNGTMTEPDPTSSTTSSSSSTTSTTEPCSFVDPATGEKVPALPEDCINMGNPPATVSTVTTPPGTPTTGPAPLRTNPVLVDPSTTTVASAPAPTGSVRPPTEALGDDQAPGEPPTTTGTTAPQGDIALDDPVATRSAQVRGISYEPRADPSSAVEALFPEPLSSAAQALAVDSPSFVISFPWDRGNPIGVELGPGRVLGAWVIWMTITLLIMAFWVPSPTRRTSRVTVRKPRSAARRV